MNDRIDSKHAVAQSTSNLPVISPENSKTTDDVPMATAVMAEPLPVRRKKSKTPTRSSQAVPTLPLAPSNESNLGWTFAQNDTETEDHSIISLSRFSYIYGMPSWMISFVVHLVILILLALLSFGAANIPQTVSLEMSDSDSVADLQMFEVAVDFEDTALEDTSDALEKIEVEELSTETSADVAKSLLGDMKSQLPATTASDNANGDAMKLARGDGKSVQFFGAGAEGTNFVFVIDCSGSMDDDYRWDAAKRELKSAIGSLTLKQKYYVFLYNSFGHGMTNKKPKLVPPNKFNRDRTFKWLDRQRPVGDTRPRESMRASINLKPDAIFLLSDGELRDNTVQFLQNFNRDDPGDEYTPLRKKVPIHTIFLGNGFGDQTMKLIAEQNDGSFTSVRK